MSSGNIGNGENIMTVVNTEYSLWLFHDIYLPQEYTRIRLLSHIHVGQIRKVFVFTQHQNTTLALNARAWYWAKISRILNCKEFKWNMVSVTFIINSSNGFPMLQLPGTSLGGDETITMTSWWARWRLILFTQTFIQGADQRKHQSSTSPATSEFPAQMASNVENVSIYWRHHGKPVLNQHQGDSVSYKTLYRKISRRLKAAKLKSSSHLSFYFVYIVYIYIYILWIHWYIFIILVKTITASL